MESRLEHTTRIRSLHREAYQHRLPKALLHPYLGQCLLGHLARLAHHHLHLELLLTCPAVWLH